MATILPDQLDVVIRETDFVLYHQGQPLRTPAGHVIAHANSRLLEHILREGHEAGLVLPLLLILGRITASEYANTLSCIHLDRNLTAHPDNDPAGVKQDQTRLQENAGRMRTQAMGILEYLEERLFRRLFILLLCAQTTI